MRPRNEMVSSKGGLRLGGGFLEKSRKTHTFMSDECAYVPQKILVFCRLTIPIHQYTIVIGIQFIRDKFTGCSLNTKTAPKSRNRRETTFTGSGLCAD